ncbi:hypothetical protein VQ03_01095 [Methylobacterium tarhaniae]|uniref:Uncharacterized protein n=1 Tax=Methylobacterium tarhaniae TaxID=1187852 RepID=A0A0J6TFX7_9HYPH|nr:hypothetical protein [Methylobacterium tarhaniae]KMO44842.1 hypothetical protein VQ03_01095 [Methylobacterium tarhaniae]
MGVLSVAPGRSAASADAFADAVRHGPAVPASLPEALRASVVTHIEGGFSAAFPTIAIFAMVNAVLA